MPAGFDRAYAKVKRRHLHGYVWTVRRSGGRYQHVVRDPDTGRIYKGYIKKRRKKSRK